MEVKYITAAQDTDATIKELIEHNKMLQQKINEYQNKFNRYTKEQSGLMLKIQKVKKRIIDSNLKMTGRNTYNKYNYFELKDITPCIVDSLLKEGLSSTFFIKDNNMYLQIVDAETGAWQQWHTPLRPPAQVKGGDAGQGMKTEQMLQTYARRTLWLQSLEIIEPVELEQPEGAKAQKKAASKKVEKSKKLKLVQEPKKPAEPEKTPREILNSMNEELERGGYSVTLERAGRYLERKINNNEITEAQKEGVIKLLTFNNGGVENGSHQEN